jgi:hypothetical protein
MKGKLMSVFGKNLLDKKGPTMVKRAIFQNTRREGKMGSKDQSHEFL